MNTESKDVKDIFYKIILKDEIAEKTFKSEDAIAQLLFEFLVREKDLQQSSLALYSCCGALLTAFPSSKPTDKSHNVKYKEFPAKIEPFSDAAYIITTHDRIEPNKIESLQNSFVSFFSVLCHNERLRRFIFDGLDALPNSICVYDENLYLIYANTDFCNYLHIKDRDAALGRYINDILRESGVHFTSVKKPSGYLKVNDVIRYGKPVINWEVEVTDAKDPSSYMVASNDMYPMFSEGGKVCGVSEISRSRNIKIEQARDTLGLVADYTFEDIVGNSKAMSDAKQMAMSFAVSPYNVLIYGESGVGKELFAQSIHNYSVRRNKPFVAINCAGISPELIDSELFGYESGAFTGAARGGHVGKFELSDGGTLFLDEIAELPLHAQTKLLRTLETQQITKVGGSKNISVDVRVIAATNRSLEKMIKEGLFREDLYYRLMVLNLTIPPLRDRPEDILPCCEFFLAQVARINNTEEKSIDSDAKKLLLKYNWPGNTRELRNIMNRVCVMSNSRVITRDTLISAFQSNQFLFDKIDASKTADEILHDKRLAAEQSYASLLKEAILLANGNKSEAAKLLGVSRKTLYNMMDRYKEYFQ